MTGHSPWDELAVGLALGALEPEDEQTFLDHLRTCLQCAQTVADIESVAGDLAYAVPAEEPPPALLDSIMREVHASARAVTPLGRAMPSVPRLRPQRGSATRGASGRSSAGRSAVRWDASWLTRAAALVVVLALGAWNYQLRLDNQVKQTSLNNAAAAGALLADPTTQTVKLDGAGGEKATMFFSGDRGYLVVDNFARNDAEDSIYVLWSQNKGSQTMDPVISFKVVADRPTYVPVRGKLSDSAAIQVFAVSKEAGSRIPATPSAPIAVGKTSAAT